MPRKTKRITIVIAVMLCSVNNVFAQEPETLANKILNFPAKAQSAIDKKIKKADAAFEKTIDKQLAILQKQENRIYKKLCRKDSAAASNYLLQSAQSIATLKDKLANPGKQPHYIPFLDTLKTSFQFLHQQNEPANLAKQAGHKTATSLKSITALENRLNKAEELKQFLRRRKEYLAGRLSESGLVKELKNINKQAFYYAQQINEYREILNDPKKIEKKAIELLSKTKLFQEFMSRHSLLASLFPAARGSTTADPAAFLAANPTLQTRALLNSLVQQQLSAGGPNAQASFQQNLQEAQAQLTQLKDRVLKAGAGNSDDDPGSNRGPGSFKPNNQKVKSFLKRLEYGTNIQTQKATSYFPVTGDVALSVGYKLNDRSVLGISASFKLGFGRGWNNIQLSSQGVGLRSFIDWKLKGSLFISGGYEQNYRPALREPANPSPLGGSRTGAAWQQSGLIGISKSVPVKTKFFKKTSVKLLWDFLSYKQVPLSQPIIFRIGYNF